MKKIKSTLALCLALFICLSTMTALCYAAEAQVNRTVVCQTDGVSFRREMGGEVIGYLMKGDLFYTTSADTAAWYYGTPDTATAIYQAFGQVDGYVRSLFFNLY